MIVNNPVEILEIVGGTDRPGLYRATRWDGEGGDRIVANIPELYEESRSPIPVGTVAVGRSLNRTARGLPAFVINC